MLYAPPLPSTGGGIKSLFLYHLTRNFKTHDVIYPHNIEWGLLQNKLSEFQFKTLLRRYRVLATFMMEEFNEDFQALMGKDNLKIIKGVFVKSIFSHKVF